MRLTALGAFAKKGYRNERNRPMTNKDIAKHINSLLVWDRMVNDRTKSSKDRDNAMRWFNESAKALTAAGISVVGYGVEYVR